MNLSLFGNGLVAVHGVIPCLLSYCVLQNSAQRIFYSAIWNRIGYHISSNQCETTMFGPKVMRIGALLAKIPQFHYMARIGH